MGLYAAYLKLCKLFQQCSLTPDKNPFSDRCKITGKQKYVSKIYKNLVCYEDQTNVKIYKNSFLKNGCIQMNEKVIYFL